MADPGSKVNHNVNELSKKLLEGWTLMSDSCPKAHCNVPLVQNKEGHIYCISCESFIDPNAPKPSRLSPHTKPRYSPSQNQSTLSNPFGDSFGRSYLAGSQNALSNSFSGSNSMSSVRRGQNYSPSQQSPQQKEHPWKPTNMAVPTTDAAPRRKTENASAEIAQKLLQGWNLLNEYCPNPGCAVPLVGNAEKERLCVTCGSWSANETPGNKNPSPKNILPKAFAAPEPAPVARSAGAQNDIGAGLSMSDLPATQSVKNMFAMTPSSPALGSSAGGDKSVLKTTIDTLYSRIDLNRRKLAGATTPKEESEIIAVITQTAQAIEALERATIAGNSSKHGMSNASALHPTSASQSRSRHGSPSPSGHVDRSVLLTDSSNALHRKARQTEIRFPQRSVVPDNRVPWEMRFESYHPGQFTHQSVNENPRADPPNCHLIEDLRNRKSYESHTLKLDSVTMKPLNPRGRTGMADRGVLPLWGPNHSVVLILSRISPSSGRMEVLVSPGRDAWSEGVWQLPYVEGSAGDVMPENMKTLLKNMTDVKWHHVIDQELHPSVGTVVYSGYWDSNVNTDNAWLEQLVVHVHASASLSSCLVHLDGEAENSMTRHTCMWVPVDRNHKVFSTVEKHQVELVEKAMLLMGSRVGE